MPQQISIVQNLPVQEKGKHRARFVNVEIRSGSEISTPGGAESDNREEYTFEIDAQKPQTTKPIFQVRIMDTSIHTMADSGATVDILSKRDFDSLKLKPQLTDTNVKVYLYMWPTLLVITIHQKKHSTLQRSAT